MGDHWFVIAVGFLAQAFFSARILVQWIVSERARRVLSPSIFWMLSLAGAYLLCLYGWMRNDFAIVLGQFVSYYIYIWNLKVKGIMRHLPSLMKVLLLATPVLLLVFVSGHAAELDRRFLHNSEIPLPLLLFGSAGQLIFTLRFVYQWYYSYRKGESHLPAGFWILSLVGAAAIVTYGIVRHDIVLIAGQSFGVVAYSRNLFLLSLARRGKGRADTTGTGIRHT